MQRLQTDSYSSKQPDEFMLQIVYENPASLVASAREGKVLQQRVGAAESLLLIPSPHRAEVSARAKKPAALFAVDGKYAMQVIQ